MKAQQTKIRNFLLHSDHIALFLIFSYVAFFATITILKYYSFSYNDFDLAVHAQTMHNLLRGSIDSSLLGIPFLGNHCHLILFLIVPIYAAFKSPLTLLVLQTIALGFSGYPLYLIAKRELSKQMSLAILFSYLLYPCIGYVNLYEFHPTSFGTFLIALMLLQIYRNRRIAFYVCAAVTLLCQENMALIIVFVGFYLLIIKRKPVWWGFPIGIGLLWFWLAAFMVIPHFGKGTIAYMSLYRGIGGSVGEIIKNVVIESPLLLATFLTRDRIYLLQVFGPVFFLPFASPTALLGAIPTFLQHFLSRRPTEHVIYYHYTAEIIPFVFLSFIYAVKKILTRYRIENLLCAAIVIVAIVSNWCIGPHFHTFLGSSKYFRTKLDQLKEQYIKQVPPEAGVVASFEFLPRLSNREKVYSLYSVATGTYTLSERPYVLPRDCEYALVNFGDRIFRSSWFPEETTANLRDLFQTGDFGIVDMVGMVALFKRGFNSDARLYEILEEEPILLNQISGTINGDMELMACRLDKKMLRRNLLPVSFYWRCLEESDMTYYLALNLIDEKGATVRTFTRFICYRLYPTNEWQPGQVIIDNHTFVLPADLPHGTYRLCMSVLTFNTKAVQKLRFTINGTTLEHQAIDLIEFKKDDKRIRYIWP